MMDPFTISLLSQLGIAGFQGIKSIRDAQSFEGQKQPSYRDSSQELEENRNLAKTQMKQGMSPEARALANNAFITQQAGATRAASEMSGGQMSNAMSRLGALNAVNYATNLGAQDQAARERGRSAYMGVNQQLQGQRDKDTAMANQNYLQTRQNIQGMSQYALQNLGNAVSGYAAGDYNNRYLEYLMGKDKTGTIPTTPEVTSTTPANAPFPQEEIVSKKLSKISFSDNLPISVSSIVNPTVGQTAFANGKTWQWDGSKWNEI